MKAPNPEILSTGSLCLDLALGIGGLPRGRIIEIYGVESVGKTTLCLHLISQAQKPHHIPTHSQDNLDLHVDALNCALIDVDGTLDPDYARRCGVQPEHLYIAEPEYAEQALEITESLARSGTMTLIIVDSVSTLVSQHELNTTLGQDYREPSQDLLSKALRKLRRPIQHNNTTLVFTNRTPMFGNTIYHRLASNPARLSLKLHSAVRLKLSPQHLIYRADEIVGQQILVEVQKNRFWPYHHTTKLDIMYNDGIVSFGSLFDLAIQFGLIRREGGYYTFQGNKLGIDKDASTIRLKVDTRLRTSIEQAIRRRYLPTVF